MTFERKNNAKLALLARKSWFVPGGGCGCSLPLFGLTRGGARLSASLVFILLGVSMSTDAGIFGLFDHTMSWKEEILLQNGQIIVAERFYHLGGYPEIASTERAALDETVTFSLPSTNKKIIWKTDFRDTEPEPNSLNLILFDVVKGVPYIATYPAGCIAYNKWKRPNPPQILFKYENDQWTRIAVAEFPAGLTKANVIVGRPATKLLKPFYTVAQVNEKNRYIDTPGYGAVLREAVKPEPCPKYSSGPKAPIPIAPKSSQK